MPIRKILSQSAVLILIAISIYLSASLIVSYSTTHESRLATLWNLDISELTASNRLPAYWSDIRIVEKICGPQDLEAQKWIKIVAYPFQINPNGQYKLEVLFISDDENSEHRAILRHHIVHIPSGNSVWELSRTYDLD